MMVPPQFVSELFATMLFCSVAVPSLKIPPAEFPLTVLLFIAKFPEPLTMAPPVPLHTPEQVTPSSMVRGTWQ